MIPSGGDDQVFIANPDINLTDWIAGTAGEDVAHYGASFLFTTYFLDRFGADTTKAFIHNQQMVWTKSTVHWPNATSPTL